MECLSTAAFLVPQPVPLCRSAGAEKIKSCLINSNNSKSLKITQNPQLFQVLRWFEMRPIRRSLVPTAQCKRKDFEGSALHKDSKTRKTWTRRTRRTRWIHCASERFTPIISCIGVAEIEKHTRLRGMYLLCGCKYRQVEKWESRSPACSLRAWWRNRLWSLTLLVPLCPLLPEFKCCFVSSPNDIAEKKAVVCKGRSCGKECHRGDPS